MAKRKHPNDGNRPRKDPGRTAPEMVLTRDPACERLAKRMHQVGIERHEFVMLFPESGGEPLLYALESTITDDQESDTSVPQSEAILVLDDFYDAIIRAVPTPPPNAPKGPGDLAIGVTVAAERRGGGRILQKFATRAPANRQAERGPSGSRKPAPQRRRPQKKTAANKRASRETGAAPLRWFSTFIEPLPPNPPKRSEAPSPPVTPHAGPEVLRVSKSFENAIYECSEGPTAVMKLLIVYPHLREPYACLGDTTKLDGTVIPWYGYDMEDGYAHIFAKELLAAFPAPPRNAPPGPGEIVVGIEIRPYDKPGERVRRTFVSRRPGPPQLPPYSAPVR
jgi:hypothetical protein